MRHSVMPATHRIINTRRKYASPCGDTHGAGGQARNKRWSIESNGGGLTYSGGGHRAVGAVGRAGSIQHVGSTLVGLGGRPVSQPVVDGDNDGVFEEFGRHHEENQEEAARRQVTPAHLTQRDVQNGQ